MAGKNGRVFEFDAFLAGTDWCDMIMRVIPPDVCWIYVENSTGGQKKASGYLMSVIIARVPFCWM